MIGQRVSGIWLLNIYREEIKSKVVVPYRKSTIVDYKIGIAMFT